MIGISESSLPTSWAIKRLDFVARVKARLGWKGLTASEYVDDGYAFLSTPNIKGHDIDFEEVNYIDAHRFFESPEIMLQQGDVLLTKDGSTLGTCSVVRVLPKPATVNGSIAVIRPTVGMDPIFLYWVFSSPEMQAVIRQFKDGMGVPHLFQSDLRKFRVIVPPIDEQRSIAEFLDREITMLDHLIDQKRRLRELIEHSRRAVIAAAVTRGVRDVPLKSSGIEWFGDIPRHWTVNRLGRLSEEINDINHEMPVAVAGGIPFLSAKDLKDDGSLNFTEDVKLISREDFVRLATKIVPKRDDIVYSRYGACLGKARLVETDLEFLVSYSCVIIRLRKEIADPKFFTYLLDSDLVLNEARFRTQGIAVPDLGNKMIAKFAVPVPPIEEQQEIAARLDKEVLELRRTSDTIRLGIERLREFRAALISAAVTGQVDVRNYRPQETAAACL